MFTIGQIVRIGKVNYEVLICSKIDIQYSALLKEGWVWSLGLKANGQTFTAFSDGKNFSKPKTF